MKKSRTVFARNLPIGSVVVLYNEDWICRGIVSFFDGTLDVQRVMLTSVRDSSRLAFVRFSQEFFTFSDSFYTEFPIQ